MADQEIQEIKLTLEKSKQLADVIEFVKIYLPMVDQDYLKATVKAMRKQVGFQESCAVLHPSYPQSKNDHLAAQADALELFGKFFDKLKQCEAIKSRIGTETGARGKIEELFL